MWSIAISNWKGKTIPSARLAYEKLKWMVENGRAEEKVHVVFVEQDQKERIKNERKVTKFVLETKSPDACSELHAEWDRIIRRVGHNKSIALELCIRAWRDALADREIDKIMAAMEGPDA